MLLKQSNPEHATNSTMDSPSLSPQDTAIPRADPLDDVFGSDSDDDSPVFEQEPAEGSHSSHIHFVRQDGHSATAQHHPSDMYRLQQEHTTAGYRDGITVAKASSVQAGFDEGFGLGATIGLKVGRLLGVLEGIVGALRADDSSAAASAEAEETSKLLSEARTELHVRSVFSEAYWHADGTWKYDVEPEGSNGEGQEDEAVLLFSHVAEAHPLVKKWTATTEREMRKWGLQEQLPLLQRREDEDEPPIEPVPRVKVTAQSQSEAKAPSDALSW